MQVGELWQEMLGVVCCFELGLIGWRHCLRIDNCPVNLIEPGVRLDLLSICRPTAQTLRRVLMQEFDAQILSFVRYEAIVKPRLCILNILIELLAVL